MKRWLYINLVLLMMLPTAALAQLSLDSCRRMALANNKPLAMSMLKHDVAYNTRKAARTKYLPRVDALGSYVHTSKEVSILNSEQKNALNFGTNYGLPIEHGIGNIINGMADQGIISYQTAQELGALVQKYGGELVEAGDAFGGKIRDAFRTDTRNVWAGSVMLTQPIYMGGAITAGNKMADIAEDLSRNDIENTRQNTIQAVDKAYWTVASLHNKKQLAESYKALVDKLNDDVHKMIEAGVATKADGLRVDVKANEADMTLVQVDNGLSLAKMLLCQICGMEISDDIVLEDEGKDNIATEEIIEADTQKALDNRYDLKMLENANEISKQSVKLARAEFLPQVALTGGYLISNPNVFNGFEKKFAGVWNIGVMVHIPVWNWMEGAYKVRAAKALSNITSMQVSEAQELVTLQIKQQDFKLQQARKRLVTTQKNINSAEENLRCANVGYKEGVIEVSEVMAAQTAWMMAKSQQIDAEIEVKMASIDLKKAMGVLE